jgi:hypothetical protein
MTLFDLKSSPRDRLEYLQRIHGITTLEALADRTRVPVDTLKGIRKRNKIGSKTATRIATAFGVEYNWVKSGEGDAPLFHRKIGQKALYAECFKTGEGPAEQRCNEIEGHFGLPPVGEEKIGDLVGTNPVPCTPDTDFYMVEKVKTKLSGGGGIIPEEGLSGEYYAFRLPWLKQVASVLAKLVIFDVDGDSMSPTLMDKDTVLVDCGRKELREGRIYAIAVGDMVQIKRLQLLAGGKIKVISDNPAYHTYDVRISEIRIIGQMIWYARTVI